jgi:hypothetical protein
MADLKMTHTLKYVTEYSVMSALRRKGEFLVLVPESEASLTGISDLRRGVPLAEYVRDNGVSIVEIMPAKSANENLFIIIFQEASFEGVIATESRSGMEADYADMLAGTLVSALAFLVNSEGPIPANGEMTYLAPVSSGANGNALSYGQVLAILEALAVAH